MKWNIESMNERANIYELVYMLPFRLIGGRGPCPNPEHMESHYDNCIYREHHVYCYRCQQSYNATSFLWNYAKKFPMEFEDAFGEPPSWDAVCKAIGDLPSCGGASLYTSRKIAPRQFPPITKEEAEALKQNPAVYMELRQQKGRKLMAEKIAKDAENRKKLLMSKISCLSGQTIASNAIKQEWEQHIRVCESLILRFGNETENKIVRII